MFISSNGSLVSSDMLQVADTINVNLSLDIYDVPGADYGIIQNFAKDTYSQTEDIIKLMVLDFLSYNKLTAVNLSGIDYSSGVFRILFDYKNKKLSADIS